MVDSYFSTDRRDQGRFVMVAPGPVHLPPWCAVWRCSWLLDRLHPALQSQAALAPWTHRRCQRRRLGDRCRAKAIHKRCGNSAGRYVGDARRDSPAFSSEKSDATSTSPRPGLDHQNWWIIPSRERVLVDNSRRRSAHQQKVGQVRPVLPSTPRRVDRVSKSLCGTVACMLMAYHMVRSVVALRSMF